MLNALSTKVITALQTLTSSLQLTEDVMHSFGTRSRRCWKSRSHTGDVGTPLSPEGVESGIRHANGVSVARLCCGRSLAAVGQYSLNEGGALKAQVGAPESFDDIKLQPGDVIFLIRSVCAPGYLSLDSAAGTVCPVWAYKVDALLYSGRDIVEVRLGLAEDPFVVRVIVVVHLN